MDIKSRGILVTKKAVEDFEKNIVNEHNFLNKVKSNLNKGENNNAK